MSVGKVLQSGIYWDYGTVWGWQVYFDEHPDWVQVRLHRELKQKFHYKITIVLCNKGKQG